MTKISELDIPEDMKEVAALTGILMEIIANGDVKVGLRAVSACLAMILVDASATRESADDALDNIHEMIANIIETMDREGMGGWHDTEGHTLQ